MSKIQEASERMNRAGAEAVGMLNALIRNGDIPEYCKAHALQIVQLWDDGYKDVEHLVGNLAIPTPDWLKGSTTGRISSSVPNFTEVPKIQSSNWARTPYPEFCDRPECRGLSVCPKDPTCAD